MSKRNFSVNFNVGFKNLYTNEQNNKMALGLHYYIAITNPELLFTIMSVLVQNISKW